MIKAIIFDYGGVISDGGSGNEVSVRLAKSLDISNEEAFDLLLGPWHKLFDGSVDETGFWELIEKKYGSNIPLDNRGIWNSWEDMKPRPELIEFVNELKTKKYIVGLLSNIVPHTEALIREGGAYDLFDPCILSFKVHSAKPDINIYKELLKQLPGIAPDEVIFVDDQERCLVPAKELGIKVVLASNSEQIISDIDKMLAD